MKILAFDIATATGCCSGEIHSKGPKLFSIVTEGASLGRFLLDGRRKYLSMIKEEKPDLIIIEAPVKNPWDSIVKQRKVLGLSAHLITIATDLGIPCTEASPKTVKKILSGDGRASKDHQKIAAFAMGVFPDNDDQADAFSLWLIAIEAHAPKAFAYWKERQNNIEWRQNLWDIQATKARKKPKAHKPKLQPELI